MFIICNGLPYFVKINDMTKMYPCEIDAFSYKVDFNKSLITPTKIQSVMTDEEIRAKFNIIPIDDWDNENNKLIAVSNKKITSIINSAKTTK